MFCKWCGNKITNNGVSCPTCGKAQDALENGNGFWDLCEVVPKGAKQAAVPLASVESLNVSDEKRTQAKRGDHQKAKKASRKRGNGIVVLVGALCLLVAVGVIESSIALSRSSKCMDMVASIKTQLSGLRTDVSNGVSEIEEHVDAVFVTTDTQMAEGSESTESTESTEIAENNDDVNEILNSENTVSIMNGEITVESHEIESTKADTVLIVSGYPVEGENTRIVWQQFNIQNEEWDTIAENQDYILLKENDEIDQIRVLCITQNELGEYTVYGTIYMLNDDNTEPEDSTNGYSNLESNEENTEAADQ